MSLPSPASPGLRVLAAVLAVVLATSATAAPVSGQSFVGRPLSEALEALTAHGLPILFSNAVVPDELVVRSAPPEGEPRQVLRALLSPHGLTVEEGPGGRLIVVAAEDRAEGDAGGGAAESSGPFHLAEARHEIVVHATPHESGHGEPVGALEVPPLAPHEDFPHLGGDALIRAALLPGATSGEAAGRLSVGGGREEELTVVLDGLELVAPYHLQEFDGALGIVPAEPLARVELISGLSPVEFGDRLGTVLDMTSLTQSERFRGSLGLGSLFAAGTATGASPGGERRWLASARAGNYRLALEANGLREDPRYWDFFGKTGQQLSPGQTVQLHALLAEDEFSVDGGPVGGGEYSGQWQSSYAWLTHLATPGPRVSGETVAWAARLERQRRGHDAQLGSGLFDLDDQRRLDLSGIKSHWRVASPRQRWRLAAGGEVREMRSSIDYAAQGRGGSALTLPAVDPVSEQSFSARFDDHRSSGFASLRSSAVAGLEVEAGLRYDTTSLTDEEHTSPRFHLAWAPGDGGGSGPLQRLAGGVLRASWGRQIQSQRPYELQVEDGETDFHPAERAEHRSLSWEGPVPWAAPRAESATWRVGLYQRRTGNPRPRFESLFDIAVLYPELAPGRVRLAPTESRAEGLNLTLRSAPGPRWTGSASWSLALTEDRLDGRWVPRATDQTHSVLLTSRLHLGRRWWVGGVWRYHTGWPTTAVRVGAYGDGLVPGPLRGERLPAYHRLDLRLGHTWEPPVGSVSAWIDLVNVYDRDNVRGYGNFAVTQDAAGRPVASREMVAWRGFLPTAGLRWSF